MNPHSNETGGNQSGIQLPVPIGEQMPPANAAGEAQKTPMETTPGVGIERAAASPAQALPPMPVLPLPTAPAAAQPPRSAVTATTNAAVALVADDGDLIEKEWVEKAKAIVDRNRDDPHKQSEELTVFKAGYMQQRYNKTIKLNK